MRTLIRWGFWIITLLLALALLAWLTGRVVSDRYVWSQFLLWTPTPVAIAVTLLGLLIALVRAGKYTIRSEVGVWSAALVALLVYFSCVEHRFLHRAAREPAGITIVHWNAWPDEGDDGEAYFTPIAEIDADIYILTDAWHVPWRMKARERFGEDIYLAGTHPFAIISTLPIIEVRPTIAHERMFLAVLILDTTEQFGRPLTIHAVDQPSDLDLARRDVAQTYLTLMADTDPATADVAVGDYNMTPGHALHLLAEGMTNAYSQAGHGWRGTFTRQWPLAQIDHTFVREPFVAERYDIIDPGISRHRLQKVWINLAEE